MVKINAYPGDRVELHFMKTIYEGTLIESPESDKGVVLLKLDNGYNIGFNKKDVMKTKVLKKSKSVEEKIEIKKNPSKPNIGMIITGGTIAARLNPKKGGVDWLDTPESLFRFYPEIFEKVNVSKVEIPFMKASEDMDYRDWQKIARSCEKLLNDSNVQGVVITHGTDFLHYTASALSFFFSDKLTKPIVLTYSQRSIDRASSDANLNLVCSAEIAGLSEIAEVVLVGHSSSNDDYCYVMPGTKVKKMHTSRRDAFHVINDTPIAKVFSDGNLEVLDNYNKRKKGKVKSDLKFEDKIALVKIYPGQDPGILDWYVKNKYKGIILEVSGLAHVPTMRSRTGWTKKLKEIISKGIVVCATAQTINGRLDPYVYSNGREVLDAGVIFLKDMLSETALTKLGWVLGHEAWAKDKKLVKEKMLENISREFNDRLEFEN